MKKVGIIGAGPSGLFAAINLANENIEVSIIEKNHNIGKKLSMTGNGRCNLTNAKVYEDFLENIVSNKKFFYSSFNSLDNFALMDFFESRGLALVSEDDYRVFPKSQKSKDIIKFFSREIIEKNIRLISDEEVIDISKDKSFKVICKENTYNFDYLIIATGGLSYPLTGSTGDGYKFAQKFGHSISKTYPSLVPIFFKDKDLENIKAISLDDVKITVRTNEGTFSKEGPILISKNFISGPSVISLSSFLVDKKIEKINLNLLNKENKDLDEDLIKLFNDNPKKDCLNIIREIIPETLAELVVDRSLVNSSKKGNQISKHDRKNIINNLRDFSLDYAYLGGYNTAIITKGGVNVDEINPKTMESKLVNGLFFIGEILNIDGLTGGFNLQIAFSTAFAATSFIKEEVWNI